MPDKTDTIETIDVDSLVQTTVWVTQASNVLQDCQQYYASDETSKNIIDNLSKLNIVTEMLGDLITGNFNHGDLKRSVDIQLAKYSLDKAKVQINENIASPKKETMLMYINEFEAYLDTIEAE